MHTQAVGPLAGLAAVGRCRVHLDNPFDKKEEFKAIVAKNVQQAQVDTMDADDDTKKKLKEKYRREGVAMARAYLTKTLGFDVSMVDVSAVVGHAFFVGTDGCLAACLLDAGFAKVETYGRYLGLAAGIPRERLAAYFHYDGRSFTVTSLVMEYFQGASGMASSVSVYLDYPEHNNLETILEIFSLASQLENLECVVNMRFPPTDEFELEWMMQEIATKAPKGRICLVDPTARQLGLAYAANIRTDREDMLYPTVVCTRSGVALGLVYSSKVNNDEVIALHRRSSNQSYVCYTYLNAWLQYHRSRLSHLSNVPKASIFPGLAINY
jgi:hypothetical protein